MLPFVILNIKCGNASQAAHNVENLISSQNVLSVLVITIIITSEHVLKLFSYYTSEVNIFI